MLFGSPQCFDIAWVAGDTSGPCEALFHLSERFSSRKGGRQKNPRQNLEKRSLNHIKPITITALCLDYIKENSG